MGNLELDFEVRNLRQQDFFWLKEFNCAPLKIERDSIYLFFCVHFSNTCFVVTRTKCGTPIGFLLGFLPQDSVTAYIHYLFVVEHYRHNGVGSTLLKYFSRVVGNLGAKEITLFTSKAVDFYRKQGFEETNSIFTDPVVEYIENQKNVRIMRAVTNG